MSIEKVQAYLSNRLSYPGNKAYTGILGANPSKGARSPILWNAAFSAHGLDIRMLAMDLTEANLFSVLDTLDQDRDFRGGAIAVPYKEQVASWLAGRLTVDAAAIGSVNCLFRGANGRLFGTNTDGEAALVTFRDAFGSLNGKNIVLLGAGGAGKAVASYFARGATRMTLCTRSSAESYARKIGAQWCPWIAKSSVLATADIVINCTSIGFGDQANESPLDTQEIAILPKHAVVFDIGYQPRPSCLLQLATQLGYATFDGAAMNLEQAVLAYCHVNPTANPTQVRCAMATAKASPK